MILNFTPVPHYSFIKCGRMYVNVFMTVYLLELKILLGLKNDSSTNFFSVWHKGALTKIQK
uniref:Uncharacterized protein n=1 Tax=Anguilla anguilla TaxID=7936 RepID=A0A0E9X255_ANGAN